MAVPKKKVSRRRRDIRRFNPANLPPRATTVPCKGCGEYVRAHTICMSCMKNGDDCHYYQARLNKKAGATASQAKGA